MKKILLIIIDGLGDKPIARLGDKTPLEAAQTPNLDYLAKEGISGLMEPVFTTAIPTSEEAHFSLFGYDPKVYPIARGVLTAGGAGLKIKEGDVALRGNFATVDNEMNVVDRRAGRIKETQPLIDSLNGIKIDGVKFLIKSAGVYRIGIVMRGKGLNSNISDGDPHYGKMEEGIREIIPLNKIPEAAFTAKVLNKFLEKSHQILKNHSLNEKRKKNGFLPANYILTREAGSLFKVPSFKEKYNLRSCCIAGSGKVLYQQIGRVLGMDLIEVVGADSTIKTNLKGKFTAAKKSLEKYDFVFCHIKAADSLAEDGDFIRKKEFIEKIDKNLEPLLNLKNSLIVITADHSTCSELKRHCLEPIPLLIYGNGQDEIQEFSEKACKKGGLGKIDQLELMKNVLKLR